MLTGKNPVNWQQFVFFYCSCSEQFPWKNELKTKDSTFCFAALFVIIFLCPLRVISPPLSARFKLRVSSFMSKFCPAYKRSSTTTGIEAEYDDKSREKAGDALSVPWRQFPSIYSNDIWMWRSRVSHEYEMIFTCYYVIFFSAIMLRCYWGGWGRADPQTSLISMTGFWRDKKSHSWSCRVRSFQKANCSINIHGQGQKMMGKFKKVE